MNRNGRFSRRKFLFGSAVTLGGAILAWTHYLLGTVVTKAQEPIPTPRLYLPIVYGASEPAPNPRVIHVRDGRATNWDGTQPFYNTVDQEVVTGMVLTGLQRLTGEQSWPKIWPVLFERINPDGYLPGQKIAIKINLNNSRDCESHNQRIDALPQPILALVSGMAAAGVQPSDVIVYDSIRAPSSYLRDRIRAVYPDLKFLGTGSCPDVITPSYGMDPSLTVPFNDPYGNINDRRLVNVLYDATYVINMPIIKRHGGDNANPVTLTFKNHFGSLNTIVGSGEDDDLHRYINTSHELYRTTYSPFVDIYLNRNIRGKTVLILGDGLYGGTSCCSPPIRSWAIFGSDACNSLFFGVDPVATDCVMADLIVAEGLVSKAHTYDYLFCAQERGLGTCEGTRDDPGGDPLRTPYGSGYEDIEYIRVDT